MVRVRVMVMVRVMVRVRVRVSVSVRVMVMVRVKIKENALITKSYRRPIYTAYKCCRFVEPPHGVVVLFVNVHECA
jgi:hypothetical protein